MNAVVLAVCVMLILSVARVPVVAAIIISAFAGGLASDMSILTTLEHFEDGIGSGASIALSYALLGAFAAAVAQSGIPQMLAAKVTGSGRHGRWWVIAVLIICAVLSQNLIPIHIAFIPLIVPALLAGISAMQLDRRALACAMSFGLVTTYMILPVGFGGIYLHEILFKNVELSGLSTEGYTVYQAMWLPALGMICGLLVALFISYSRNRSYTIENIESENKTSGEISLLPIVLTTLGTISAFVVQLQSNSMILGALVGFSILAIGGTLKWQAIDSTFVGGMKMMANIGFIMIAASGFANVIKETGDVQTLVEATAHFIGGSQALGAVLMLLVGLIITMGIGSSFSTVPIIATLFVPLAMSLGFSPLATIAIVGTAGALGDAGSPASDSTLGPTAGLNADGQHDHIRDTVIPTFVHFNIPLVIFGWIAAMSL